MTSATSDISAIFEGERGALLTFIARRVNDRDQAEVLLQTTYERATQSLQKKSVKSVRALLYVIARNLVTDYYRQKGFRSQFWAQDHDVETEVSTATDPERQAIAQQRLDMAASVIRDLPEKCRYAFVEHRFNFRSIENIADDLSLSTSMVKKHIQKAILTIQQAIEQRENGP